MSFETDHTNEEVKPRRLYFETYLQMLHNAVGTEMFRNFYVHMSDGQEVDTLSDGGNSCAFFVSGVLTLFKKQSGVHGTIKSTVADLVQSGWVAVAEADMRPGDVLVWEARPFTDGTHGHIGFYLGDNRAVSTSQTARRVIEHDIYFGDDKRAITDVFSHHNWDTP